MSDQERKPRLPFAVLDGALSGLQSAVRSVTGFAKIPFERGGDRDAQGIEAASASASASASDPTLAPSQERSEAETPLSASDLDQTATSPAALASALDEKANAALASHAGSESESVVDRIPRADTASHSGHEQPAPDEELGPKPFTPQVGP